MSVMGYNWYITQCFWYVPHIGLNHFLGSFTWSKQAKRESMDHVNFMVIFFDSVWGVLKCCILHYRHWKKAFSLEEHEKTLRNKSNAQSSPRRKRLHELFRPPIDILHHGDFQSVYLHFKLYGTWVCWAIFQSIL